MSLSPGHHHFGVFFVVEPNLLITLEHLGLFVSFGTDIFFLDFSNNRKYLVINIIIKTASG